MSAASVQTGPYEPQVTTGNGFTVMVVEQLALQPLPSVKLYVTV
jgi:ribosomal protein L13E